MSTFRRSLNRKTKSAGAMTNGRWSETTTANGTILASVQPMLPHEMDALPQGRREDQSYTLFTDTELNPIGTQNPDLITIDGEDYEVAKVSPWQNNVINHYKVFVVKVLES